MRNYCSHGGRPRSCALFTAPSGLGFPSRIWVDWTGSSRQPLLWATLQLPALCLQSNVVGRLCNECVAGSFHLSTRNPDGCLKCFCMGVSRQCTSASWSRAQVPTRGGWFGRLAGPPSPGLGGPRASHRPQPPSRPLLPPPPQVLGASGEPTPFSLTNAAGTHNTSEGISSPMPGELVSSLHSLPSGPYFWGLPSRFLGDKVGGGWEEKGNSRQHGTFGEEVDEVAGAVAGPDGGGPS